jgi:hypothetical protein
MEKFPIAHHVRSQPRAFLFGFVSDVWANPFPEARAACEFYFFGCACSTPDGA